MFAFGAGLTIMFSCQAYGWLLGHHGNLGAPMFWISPAARRVVWAGIIGLSALGLILATLRQARAGAACLVAALAAGCFLFGAFYHPVKGVAWLYSYWSLPQMGNIHTQLMLYGTGYFLMVETLLVVALGRAPRKASGAYGTAALEGGDQFRPGRRQTAGERAGLPVKSGWALHLLSRGPLKWLFQPYPARRLHEGLILGRHKKTGELLRYRGDRHLITVAPTRSGKGTSAIIPNLLDYPHTIIAIDPKGENCNITWRRRQAMGQTIWCLDPFRKSTYAQLHGSHGFNPLDAIGADDPGAIDYCKELSACIVIDKSVRSGHSHWITSGRRLLGGLILYVCTAPKYNDPGCPDYVDGARHLGTAYKLLNLPGEAFDSFIDSVIYASHLPDQAKYFANSISKKADKEKSGVISTAEESLGAFIESPVLRGSLTNSDFTLDEVFTRPSTLYIILPQNMLEPFSGWLRVVITTLLNRAIQTTDAVERSASRQRILFCLDEFANLGHLKSIETAFTVLSGYGFTFWIFIQNIAQLKSLYRSSWSTFKANSGIFQAFNANDYETARYLAQEAGQTTILTESESENRQHGRAGVSYGSGESLSIAERGRNVLTPDEIKRMDPDSQLLFPIGENPSVARKIAFFEDAYFAGLYTTREQVARDYRSATAQEDTGAGHESKKPPPALPPKDDLTEQQKREIQDRGYTIKGDDLEDELFG